MHHLSFTDEDYKNLGSLIKWNPAVKTKKDNDALWKGLLDDKLDIIATDHAPHTISEKQNKYLESQINLGFPKIKVLSDSLMEAVTK